MPLVLHVDADRWRKAAGDYRDSVPDLVPVIKGNGYGFGLHRLAAEAERLGVTAVAVGEPEEVAEVRSAYAGDILVLAPWRATGAGAARAPVGPPTDAAGDGSDRVLRTVADLATLTSLAGSGARIVVEVMTDMRRHGVEPAQLAAAAPLLAAVGVQGVALHLPMAGDPLPQARQLLSRARDTLGVDTAWVSHLSPRQVAQLADAVPGMHLRLRSGTALWLGDRRSFRTRASVLDAHRLPKGTSYGYRQRRMPYDGTLLVVNGGTAHGIGLEAPKAETGVIPRAKVLAIGVLGAAGRALSPFTVAGKQRWYAEPPHMQVSLLLLPAGVPVPAIGEEVDVEVRMTTTYVDRVEGLD